MTTPSTVDPAASARGPQSGGLDVPQGAALTIGAVLGTGVISLPALAVTEAGPASLIAWLVLLVLSVPLAATFAALGARHPDGGGVSTYARRAFGPHVATVVGWCFFITIPIGAPTAAGFAGAYVADSLGRGRVTHLVASAAIITVVAGMNWFGLRVSARVQLAIVGTLALLLLAATAVSLPHARLDNLTPFAPHGWDSIAAAAVLLVWAFAGWEVVASLSGEYRDPGRDIPRATAVAIAVISVLYLGVAFATVAVLGDRPSDAPLSELLVLGLGESARPVTTVVAVLLSIGAINAYFSGGARLGAALARDASLPAWLAHGSSAGDVPRRALSVVTLGAFASLAFLTATGLSLNAPLLLATGTFSVVYAVGTAAALRLLPVRTWGWWAACMGFAASLGLLVLTGPHLLGPALIGLGAVIWSMTHRPADRGPLP